MGQESRLREGDPLVVLGKIGAPHGVKGCMHIHSYTQPVGNILRYEQWLLIQNGKQWAVKPIQARVQGKGCVAQIENVETRDDAALLTNSDIAVFRSELPILEDGEYYWTDLVGLQVLNESDQVLGKVEFLFATGANDVISVKNADKEYCIPYTDDFVLSVDLDAQIMRVRWDPEF